MRAVPRVSSGGAHCLSSATPTGRWHPYLPPKSTPASTPSTRPTSGPQCPNTPVSNLLSSSDSFQSARNTKVSSALQAYYSSHKERQDIKRAQKEKFENALKELAVQRLCDIWKETSYVMRSTTQSSTWAANDSGSSEAMPRQTTSSPIQLPSPWTPSTNTFSSPQAFSNKYQPTLPSAPRRIPIRAFVHEVLRRSKTMWPALQIALCYLDAAKCKVPIAIAEVKQSEGLQAAEVALDKLFSSASANDIAGESPATPQSVRSSTPSTHVSSPGSVASEPGKDSNPGVNSGNPLMTVPQAPAVAPVDVETSDASSVQPRRRRTPPAPVAPLPPRPSPLLCPRRMFVAALILATKFTQDRVYSNRAWAKISGLDAREIGRCERALGEALEWRLWVGKGVADEPTLYLRNFLLAEESIAKSKTNTGIARSKSDGELLTGIIKHDFAKKTATTSWSNCDSPVADASMALKRSSSLANADLFGSPPPTLMLNDPATLVLTPANADLDAMDLQPTPLLQHSVCSSTSSSFSVATPFTVITPRTSFSSNEYSFTPAVGIPTPPFSYSPEFDMPEAAGRISGLKQNLDPIMENLRGVEGTFGMRIDDIVGNA